MRKPILAVVLAATVAAFATTAPAFGLGAQRPNENASCMGFLANSSNPNASNTIAAQAREGDASAIAHTSPTGPGRAGLISCVLQIP